MTLNVNVPKLRHYLASSHKAPVPAPHRTTELTAPGALSPAAFGKVSQGPELASAMEPRAIPVELPVEPVLNMPTLDTPITGTTMDASRCQTGKWGITTTQVLSYTPAGVHNGQLPGGTVVEIQGSANSSRGPMTICRSRQNGIWLEPVLVSAANLVFFNVDVVDLPAASLEAMRRYFEAKGLIDARIAELTQQQVKANPYTVPYREAYEKLTALQSRAKTLTDERDNATGDARNRGIDELRRMKDEQAHLHQVFTQAQTQYRNWKDQHAATSSIDPSTDPQIQAWERRMATLEPDVRKILPVP